jgi:hypothetical protein
MEVLDGKPSSRVQTLHLAHKQTDQFFGTLSRDYTMQVSSRESSVGDANTRFMQIEYWKL